VLHYTPFDGLDEVKNAVARLWNNHILHRGTVDERNVVVTSGVSTCCRYPELLMDSTLVNGK
jgi:aspartate/methionine/tyrosine aminotransferase